jgi:MAC/Perforin domain
LFQFDPFAAVPSAKPTRILVASPPEGVIEKLALRAHGYRETYADSLLEVTRKLTVDAGLKGSYGGLSGSVNSKFGSSAKNTEKRHFLKISYNVSADGYNITKDKEGLKGLLNDDFKNALANWGDVDELFNAYGTHLIKQITIGGRAEYFCQSSDISSISETDFKLVAKSKYKGAGGSLEGTGGVETVDKTKLKLVQGSESIATIGGSGEAAINLKEGHWAEWANSCKEYPGFLGFDEKDGLLPIWDLAVDSARRTAIHEAYKRRAAKALRTDILSVTSDVTAHPEARVTVPDGYKLVSGGARDNYTGSGNLITASFPESDNTWRANGKDHINVDPASITAFAIAIYDPDDIWEVKIFESTSPNDEPYPVKEVTVGPDYVMVGGGAQVHWHGEGSLLFASYPKDRTTWRAHSKEHVKSSPAKISAYAIGLKCKVTGVKVQSDIRQSESYESSRPIATAAPASGYVMTGGGAVVRWIGTPSTLLLTASYPRDQNIWEGQAKDHIVADTTVIDVQCIGLKVVDAP